MIAICLRCGEQKPAPLQLCASCGVSPVLHAEREISLGLSDALSRPTELRRYANEIQNRLRLSISDSVLAQARGALANPAALAALLGLTAADSNKKAPSDLGERPQPAHLARAPAPHTAKNSVQLATAPSLSSQETVLHRNPFWILGANPRDARRRIVELAEEKALGSDADLCQKSRTDLTNPRTRLAAEIGWLPGVSPRRAEKLMEMVVASPRAIRTESGLPTLAHVNLLAAAFETVSEDHEPADLASFILELAQAVDSLDMDAIVRDINEDRSVAGFPEVMGTDVIEGELLERRRYYRNTIKEALDRLAPAAIIAVMTKVVQEATLHGADQAHGLVDELVDSYELETQGFLEQEAENVRKLIEASRAVASSGENKVKSIVDQLERVARNWAGVAHPIIMSAKVRGTHHQASHDLAFSIRSLAIDLFNEHNLLTQSNRLTGLLQELFEHVPELAERVEQDAEALQNIFEERKQAESRHAEWAREISYRAEIGLVFKETLAISPDGVVWGDVKFPLDAITRLRWGGVRHSINGIPTGSTFTIAFGDNQSEAVVSLKREEVYSAFLEKLWRAVGIRLLTEMLQVVKSGRTLRFGDGEIIDDAIVLTRRKLFGANERVRVPWSGVQVWSAEGSFYLEAKGEKKTDLALSYIDTPNVHLLEQAVRMSFKKGARKLSDLLDND